MERREREKRSVTVKLEGRRRKRDAEGGRKNKVKGGREGELRARDDACKGD